MSLTRINKTGEPQVIPASDGRLAHPDQAAHRDPPGRRDGETPPLGRRPDAAETALARGHRWLTVLKTFIPWTLVKRGVKREVITPLDAPEAFREEATAERQARKASEDSALVRALGLAHHWSQVLDAGKAKTPADIARLETMDVTRVREIPTVDPIGPGHHRGDRRCPGTTPADVGIPVAKEHSAGLGGAAGACREPVISISLVASWCCDMCSHSQWAWSYRREKSKAAYK